VAPASFPNEDRGVAPHEIPDLAELLDELELTAERNLDGSLVVKSRTTNRAVTLRGIDLELRLRHMLLGFKMARDIFELRLFDLLTKFRDSKPWRT
jgi:hypothetical protein